MNGGHPDEAPPQPDCAFCTFGLIVTGEGEHDFLPTFMRSLVARAPCSFKVIRRIGQRNPVTSQVRIIRMVGSGTIIPDKDVEEIALPTRGFLRTHPCGFVVLVDDAEAARRPILGQVFARYRAALDLLLVPAERARAAVHFLTNMLEAYYFAHSDAVNLALSAAVLAGDHPTDVEETIPHPKNRLKTLHPGFDERSHGAVIVAKLDLDRVLGETDRCAYLRALFGWCVRQLVAHCQYHDPALPTCYQLPAGVEAELTRHQ